MRTFLSMSTNLFIIVFHLRQRCWFIIRQMINHHLFLYHLSFQWGNLLYAPCIYLFSLKCELAIQSFWGWCKTVVVSPNTCFFFFFFSEVTQAFWGENCVTCGFCSLFTILHLVAMIFYKGAFIFSVLIDIF